MAFSFLVRGSRSLGAGPRVSLLIGAAIGAVLCGAGESKGLDVYALTVQGALVKFDSATPGTVTSIGAVTGTSGTVANWRGIDFRPATGELFLLQAGLAGSPDQLYKVSTSNAAATFVANLDTAISGDPLGMDFNPVVDRLRVVTSSTKNYRVNPGTGAVNTDTDATLSPGTNSPFILGSAYTNGGILGAAPVSTVLFNIDIRNFQLTTQGNPSPNDGVNIPVGPLGVALGNAELGFDIYFNGSTNSGFVAGIPTASATSTFYTINLGTGGLTSVGVIGGGVAIRDIAVVPEPGSCALLVVGAASMVRRRRPAQA